MRSPRTWTRRRATPWLVAFAALVIMGPAVRNGWCELDEEYCRALDVRSLQPSNVLHLLRSQGVFDSRQPTVALSHALDHALFGESPTAFHAVSVGLWGLCAGLATVVAGTALAAIPELGARERTRATFVAGLLFATHPVHVENVAWLGDRKDLLGVTLALAAFLLARRARSPALGWSRAIAAEVGSLILLLAALGAKATMGTVTLAFAGDAALDPRGPPGWRERLRRAARRAGPPLALAIVVVAAWSRSLNGTALQADRAVPPLLPLEIVAHAARCLGRYVRHLVWPSGLCVYHLPHPVWSDILSDLAWLAVACAALGLALRAGGPTRRLAMLAAVAFVAALLPLSHVLTNYVAERYLLLPSPWLAAAAGGLAVLAGRRWPRATQAALCAVVVALTVATARRLPEWRDDESLWTAVVRSDPRNTFARLQLAAASLRRGDLEQATERLALARAMDQGSTTGALLEAALLEERGLSGEAREGAEAARVGSSDRPTMASLWLAQRDLERDPARAEALVRERLRRAPRDPDALALLGRALLARGAPAEALEVLERSLAERGTVDAAMQAAAAALAVGQPARAIDHAEHAEWAGITWYTRLLLGRAALALGDPVTGLDRLRAARRLVPPSETAGVAQVAVALASAGALDEARTLLAELRARGAASGPTLYDLARVEALLGRRVDAGLHLREALAADPTLRSRAEVDPALTGLLPR